MTKRPTHRARKRSRWSANSGQHRVAPYSRRLRAEQLEQRHLLSAGPRVLFSVLEGDVLSTDRGAIGFLFDNDLDESVLDVTDVSFVKTIPGSVTVPITSLSYDPATRVLLLNFDPLPDGSYRITLHSAADAFVGLDGILLDGEPNPATTVPSGDGTPGGDFVVNFVIDSTVTDFPTPLLAVGPREGLIHETSSSGVISFVDDIDSFLIDIDAGQSLSVLVEPLDAAFDPVVVLKDPSGTPVVTAQANAAGQHELIQSAAITTPGIYRLDVGATAGLGAFQIRLVVNAAIEEEPHNDVSNDTYSEAVDLESAFITLAGDSVRAAVVGRLTQEGGSSTADEDWYALSLTGGESVSLALEGVQNEVTVELFFRDYLLATGTTDGTNIDSVIRNFSFPFDGVFHVRVSGTGGTDYSLIVTRNADFSVESNFSFDTAQDISGADGALGYVLASLEGITQIEPPGEGPVPLIFDFPGPADARFIPPDPIAAAGPAQIVTLVNTSIAIYDKQTGSELFFQDLSGTEGFFGEVGATGTVFDPWVVYDRDSERFFAIGVDVVNGSKSNIYLAVSTDSTPTGGGDWYKYQIDFTDFSSSLGSGPHFADYPKMAVSGDAVWISGNYFPISFGSGRYAGLTAIDKSALLSGGPATVVYDEKFSGFSVFPVQNYGDSDVQYFVEASSSSGGTSLKVHTVSDVLTAPVRTTLSVDVPLFGRPVNVPQLGGGKEADSIDARIMTGVWRDDSIWVAHAIVDPADGESAVRWYEISAAASGFGTPSLVQSGTVDPGPGLHAWMPAVAVDGAGNLAIGFSLGGPSIYYGSGFTGRLASDPPGSTILPVSILHSGESNYVAQDDRGRNRWGDYSGLSVDPTDDATFWVFNEYAAATPNTWATQVGAFQLAVPVDDDWYQFSVREGDLLELATFTPSGGDGQFFNGLEPIVELYDPQGIFIASDNGSRSLSHTALSSGSYRVRVQAAHTTAGEYFLSVAGNTGDLPKPEVIDADPDDGQVLAAFPASYTLDFSAPLFNLSVNAGDLVIGGRPALSVAIIDGDTYRFEIDPLANVGDGQYAVELAADGVFGLQLTGNEPFIGGFRVDTAGPRVLETAFNGQPFPAGGTITAGPLVFEARINEELFALASARRGPISPGGSDVRLIDNQSGASFAPATVAYDPVGGTFTAEYDFLPEGNYTLSLVSGDGAFEDLVGNDLDGEPLGPAPDGTVSGNGEPGGDYVVDFFVDRADFPTPQFERLEPLGGMIFESLGNSGFINTPSDQDSFTMFLQQGETITAIVVPEDPGATLSVELVGLTGVLLAPAAGEAVVLPAISIDSDGTFEVRVGSDNGATSFTLDLYRNAVVEVNDSGDGAELAIDGSLVGAGADDAPPPIVLPGRYAVVGISSPGIGGTETVSPDVDEYTLDLTGLTARRIDIVLAGLDGVDFSSAAQLELLDTDGTSVLQTAGATPLGIDATNLDLAILDFAVPADGVYTLRVTSPVVGRYSIVVTQSAAFELEPHLLAPTRDLSDVGWAIGFLEVQGGSVPLNDDAVDLFQIDVQAGQILVIQTETPLDAGSATPGNSLDTRLFVLDPFGNLFGFDENSAPDGKNAQLAGVVAVGGTYTIGVVGFSGVGEYLAIALALDLPSGGFPSGGGSIAASAYSPAIRSAIAPPAPSFSKAAGAFSPDPFDRLEARWLLHDLFADLLMDAESDEEPPAIIKFG